MAIYTSEYTQPQIDDAISRILAYSGGSSDNVRMASQIGLVPNDSTKGSANGAIIASLVTAGKSLFMDKDEVYYITGGSWEIGYEFSISGKATIVCNGYMFKPVAGGSIIFDGITFRGSGGTRLIVNSDKIGYQVNRISLSDCVFSGLERVVSLKGLDIDYSVTPFGVVDFTIENCHFIDLQFSQIELIDIVVSGSNIIRNCRIDNFPYVFINAGETNDYVNDNREYMADFVVEGNIVTGSVQASGYSYHCFVLAETNRLIYKNNIISNIIGTGDAAYDVYASCREVVYEGNVIKNVGNLPVEGTVYTEILKSKGGSGIRSARNNQWYYDFDECRRLVSDILNITYTDERWSEINNVGIFKYTSPVDVVFCNNYISIKGGSINCPTASRPIVNMVFDSNVIDVEGGIGGYMMPFWSSYTQEFIVTNNIFKSGDTWSIPLFGESERAHAASTNNMNLLCTNNYSTTPIRNVGSFGSGKFIFKDNTYKNYPEDKLRIWYYLEGINGTRSEVYGCSSKAINFNSFTNGAIVTLHSDIESQGGYMELYIENNPEFDFCIPEINKAYKIRNENGTVNMYDKYDNMVTTITSTLATVIQSGDVRVDIRKYGDVPGLIFNYYDSVGHHDIEFADKELGLYDINDDYEKPISVVSATDTTLTAKAGKYYRYDSSVTSLAVTLPAMSDASRIQSIIISFTTGSSASVTFTSADNKAIAYSSGYNIETNKSYEINCLFNGVKWVIASMEVI